MNSLFGHTLSSFKVHYRASGTRPLSYEALEEIYRTSFNQGPGACEKWPYRWQEEIAGQFDFALPKRRGVQRSSDGTIKFLHELSDGHAVETVLIPFHKRYTVCLSSQVGCAVRCSFCYTGRQGLKRHLSASEIVGQYLSSFYYLQEVNETRERVLAPSIVFMGQGEPLHNFDEVKRSIEILTGPGACGIGHRQITLSTSGFMPGLKRWSELPPINLALSLHSTSHELRSELIPINEKWPLESIFEELDRVKLLSRQFITFEYLLIAGVNDTSRDVSGLVKWLARRPALVNLIPFNPYPGSKYQRPSFEQVELFKAQLVSHGLRVMVRTTKGDEILAACGQLSTAKLDLPRTSRTLK